MKAPRQQRKKKSNAALFRDESLEIECLFYHKCASCLILDLGSFTWFGPCLEHTHTRTPVLMGKRRGKGCVVKGFVLSFIPSLPVAVSFAMMLWRTSWSLPCHFVCRRVHLVYYYRLFCISWSWTVLCCWPPLSNPTLYYSAGCDASKTLQHYVFLEYMSQLRTHWARSGGTSRES